MIDDPISEAARHHCPVCAGRYPDPWSAVIGYTMASAVAHHRRVWEPRRTEIENGITENEYRKVVEKMSNYAEPVDGQPDPFADNDVNDIREVFDAYVARRWPNGRPPTAPTTVDWDLERLAGTPVPLVWYELNGDRVERHETTETITAPYYGPEVQL